MDYSIIKTPVKYKQGRYFESVGGTLCQIIVDKERGFAIYDVADGEISSDFNENLDSFLHYTTITSMTPLKLTTPAQFVPSDDPLNKYYQDEQRTIFRSVYDRDRGYAILNVSNALLVSPFYDTEEEVTAILSEPVYTSVEQVQDAAFEPTIY